MSCETEHKNIDINDLEAMLQEARKGRAKIDKQYVDFDKKGHLFDYNINFNQFLDDINYIFKKHKERNNGLNNGQKK